MSNKHETNCKTCGVGRVTDKDQELDVTKRRQISTNTDVSYQRTNEATPRDNAFYAEHVLGHDPAGNPTPHMLRPELRTSDAMVSSQEKKENDSCRTDTSSTPPTADGGSREAEDTGRSSSSGVTSLPSKSAKTLDETSAVASAADATPRRVSAEDPPRDEEADAWNALADEAAHLAAFLDDLRKAARAVVDGRVPAVSAELEGSDWKHSRIADSLTDALREQLDCLDRIEKRVGGWGHYEQRRERAITPGDFVRIHNGGGRGRVVRGPCYIIESDQGGRVTEDAANVERLK